MLDLKLSKVFEKNADAFHSGTEYICNEGGTRSGKTYSILQLLYLIACYQNYQLISIVSETMPHLKRGAMRDFFNIVGTSYSEKNHNRTDNIYTVNGTAIEFFSADNPGRVRGPARDILFINEATNIKQEIFTQLDVRTRGTTFIDWNPSHEFWAHNLQGNDNTIFIHSTYKDNPFLTDKQIKAIERRKETDANWWRVFGLGLLGMLEGLVFPEFTQIDSIPDGMKFYGLDFGFTNDPAALIEITVKDEDVYLREIIYNKGLTNTDLSGVMKGAGLQMRHDSIFADSAEPKSIEELYRLGWNIKAAEKGKDSIISGIDLMKRYKLHIHKDSLNLIKEFRNYTYEMDKDGKILNKPIDDWNHGIDAIRYGLTMKIRNRGGKVLAF